MSKLSVIVPFVNEYPQLLFTVQSIYQDLHDRCDFEIIVINNFCDEVKAQGQVEDKSFEAVLAARAVNPWLKVLHYKNKLSHWQAKNLGVQNSTGDILWFCDAHCVVSRGTLWKMFEYYTRTHEEINGTLHLPLTYKLLESHKLIYKLVYNPDIGELHYSFTGYREPTDRPHYQVPCMSTCGMMITRKLYDGLGGWPELLGIYGGGENFINYTLAILGKTINIFGGNPLHHHGEKRSYSWYYDDYTRNRIIASYMFGGKKLAAKYTVHRKGKTTVNQNILNEVLIKCKDQREMIKSKQVISIEDWVKKWD